MDHILCFYSRKKNPLDFKLGIIIYRDVCDITWRFIVYIYYTMRDCLIWSFISILVHVFASLALGTMTVLQR